MERAGQHAATTGLRLSLLGPLQASYGAEILPLGGAKQQMVLALLLLEANRVVAAERLIAWVWGEGAGDRAQGTLQVYISNLRRILAPATNGLSRQLIATIPPGYLLRIEEDELDILRLEALRRLGERARHDGQPEGAAAAFREALGLWRGEPLAGLPLGPAADGIAGRLEMLRTTQLEQTAEAELAVGRHRECLDELRSWVQAHPLNERLRGLLMIALYRCGRQVEALAAYRQGRERLVEELGIDPSRELQELEVRILEQDPALDLDAGRRRRSAAAISPTLIRPSVTTYSAVLEGDGRTFRLDRRVSTIGRLPDRDVVLQDGGVSRAHAEIRRSREGYSIVDEGSANGTSVNGTRITEHDLADGDLIKVGGTLLIFRANR